MFVQRSKSVRRQFERKANRIAALVGVGVLAVLMLHDATLWTTLLPLWILFWITLQIIFQKLATGAEQRDNCNIKDNFYIDQSFNKCEDNRCDFS